MEVEGGGGEGAGELRGKGVTEVGEGLAKEVGGFVDLLVGCLRVEGGGLKRGCRGVGLDAEHWVGDVGGALGEGVGVAVDWGGGEVGRGLGEVVGGRGGVFWEGRKRVFGGIVEGN